MNHPLNLVKPDCFPEFMQVNRYWDRLNESWVAKILPGEYYMTVNPDEWVATTLGSCVSACIRDTLYGVGGMNHFMLPEMGAHASNQGVWLDAATRYGSYAMEHLINDILKRGGNKKNFEIKLVGGGKIIANMSDVGERNIDFVRSYLQTEGLKNQVISEDLGDKYPRKVLYQPATGRLRIKKLHTLHNDTLVRREIDYKYELEMAPNLGSVELF